MIFARYNIVRFSDSLPIASGLGNKARYNRESVERPKDSSQARKAVDRKDSSL